MTTGFLGWLAVLNQLAGTSGLGDDAAANIFAGTKGLELLAALNIRLGSNLLSAVDASFESGVGAWVAGSNWTEARDSTHALDGSYSLLGTRANTTAGNGYVASPHVTASGSTAYTAIVNVIGDATSSGKAYNVKVVGNQSASYASQGLTMSTSWQQIVLNLTTAATETQLWMFVDDDPQAAPAAGQKVWIDEVGILVGTVASWTPGGYSGISGLGLNAICNALAGTTGLEACAALNHLAGNAAP